MKFACPEGRINRNWLFGKGGDLFNKNQRSKSCWPRLATGVKGKKAKDLGESTNRALSHSLHPQPERQRAGHSIQGRQRGVQGWWCNLYARWHCFAGLCIT